MGSFSMVMIYKHRGESDTRTVPEGLFGQRLRFSRLGMGGIGFQHAADFSVEGGVRDNPDHLEIQTEGAVVQVRRSDGRMPV